MAAKFFLTTLLLLALTSSLSAQSDYMSIGARYHGMLRARHEQWMERHNRVYKDSAEKASRFKIFRDNFEFVHGFSGVESNQLNRTYSMKLNAFADMTLDEFRGSHTGHIPGGSTWSLNENREPRTENSTSNFDWREHGAVGPVKDQGSCGAGWAFAAVATVESLKQIKTGELTILSEKQVVDCSYENAGCHGGHVVYALRYITLNGLTTEENYPYTHTLGCDENRASQTATNIPGIGLVDSDQDALLEAVTRQPVTTAVAVNDRHFMFYSKGVYNGGCGGTTNHMVAIVGYGTTEDGIPYWLIKNSWGTSFGEDGYMRILRNPGGSYGHCGIGSYATYPTD